MKQILFIEKLYSCIVNKNDNPYCDILSSKQWVLTILTFL